jgi:osmotically-inducible protein OsmY
MKNGVVALASFGLGAAVMYLADPERGARRRARLRDAAVHSSHTAKTAAAATSRDVENRLIGLAAKARSFVEDKPAPSDDVLTARVRSRIGRLAAHPRAIEVKAASGRVTLSGEVSESELQQLLHGVRGVDGVTEVDNHLKTQADAGATPALPDPAPVNAGRCARAWDQMTPASRLLLAATGLGTIVIAAGIASRTAWSDVETILQAGRRLLEGADQAPRPAA